MLRYLTSTSTPKRAIRRPPQSQRSQASHPVKKLLPLARPASLLQVLFQAAPAQRPLVHRLRLATRLAAIGCEVVDVAGAGAVKDVALLHDGCLQGHQLVVAAMHILPFLRAAVPLADKEAAAQLPSKQPTTKTTRKNSQNSSIGFRPECSAQHKRHLDKNVSQDGYINRSAAMPCRNVNEGLQGRATPETLMTLILWPGGLT